MTLSRQPPVHSPLSLKGLVRATRGLVSRNDVRPRLAAALGAMYTADHVTLTGSGTQALTLAITRALPRNATAVVALPAYACPEVGAAAVAAGARIALYDIDPVTLDADRASLAQVLARGAAVVVVASLYGIPPRWDVAAELTRNAGAELIEDAAQGFGASWRGRPLGSLGALSVLSFGRGKGWTGGAGGALLARGGGNGHAPLGVAGRWAEAATVARAAVQWLFARPAAYGIPAQLPWLALGETRYHAPSAPGTMTRAAAALLEVTRAVAEAEARRRRSNAAALAALLRPSGVRLARVPEEGECGWLRFPVLVRGGIAGCRDPREARRLGAAPGYPCALDGYAAVRERLAWAPDGDGARVLAGELVTLPTHSLLSAEERKGLARAVA